MLFGPDQLGWDMPAGAIDENDGMSPGRNALGCPACNESSFSRSVSCLRRLSFLYDPHMRMSLAAFTRSSLDRSQVDRTDRLPEALSRIT